MEKLTTFLCILIIIIALLQFFYFNPIGIKLGYVLNGGGNHTETVNKNPDELLRIYNEQIKTYNMYKDSDNMTAQQWAETAKQKANNIADEYNELMGKLILNKIGE